MSADRGCPPLNRGRSPRRKNSTCSLASKRSVRSRSLGRISCTRSNMCARASAQSTGSRGLATCRPSTNRVTTPGTPNTSPVSSRKIGSGAGTPCARASARARNCAVAHRDAYSGWSTMNFTTRRRWLPAGVRHSRIRTSFVKLPEAGVTVTSRWSGATVRTIDSACSNVSSCQGWEEIRSPRT